MPHFADPNQEDPVSVTQDWTTMTTPERILSVTESERNPRIWTYTDQLHVSAGTVRRHLNRLVAEGKLVKHQRGRGATYWTLPDTD